MNEMHKPGNSKPKGGPSYSFKMNLSNNAITGKFH